MSLGNDTDYKIITSTFEEKNIIETGKLFIEFPVWRMFLECLYFV